MRTVSITEIRQDATRLIEEAERTHTPLLVIQRSRATAYVVPAADYEALEQELRELRHRVFWQEVDEAQAEHQRGEGTVYDDADALIRVLGLEEAAPKRAARRPRQPAATGVPSASTKAPGKPARRSRRHDRAPV
jgi:prevent-host-death family protein